MLLGSREKVMKVNKNQALGIYLGISVHPSWGLALNCDFRPDLDSTSKTSGLSWTEGSRLVQDS